MDSGSGDTQGFSYLTEAHRLPHLPNGISRDGAALNGEELCFGSRLHSLILPSLFEAKYQVANNYSQQEVA